MIVAITDCLNKRTKLKVSSSGNWDLCSVQTCRCLIQLWHTVVPASPGADIAFCPQWEPAFKLPYSEDKDHLFLYSSSHNIKYISFCTSLYPRLYTQCISVIFAMSAALHFIYYFCKENCDTFILSADTTRSLRMLWEYKLLIKPLKYLQVLHHQKTWPALCTQSHLHLVHY